MFAFWPNKMISNQQEVLCHISALGTLLELVVRNLRPGLTFSFMTQKQISRHVLKNWKHFCLNRNSTVYLSSNADFLITTDESFRLKRRQKKYNLKYGDLPFPGIRITLLKNVTFTLVQMFRNLTILFSLQFKLQKCPCFWRFLLEDSTQKRFEQIVEEKSEFKMSDG